MKELLRPRDHPHRLLKVLALVNASIWVISVIAMLAVMQDEQAARKLAPILMAGTGAGVAVVSAISRIAR